MKSDPRIAALVPHAGSMCLLEHIVRWDADTITCSTTTHLVPAHPLATARGLRAVHLCEYGAQAMAVHGGLLAALDGGVATPGLLVSLRDVELSVDVLHELRGELLVSATRVQSSADAWQYAWRVECLDRTLARGRATVAMRRA